MELRVLFQGICWLTSGQDSVFSLLRAWIQTLAGELKIPQAVKCSQKKKKRERVLFQVCKFKMFMTYDSGAQRSWVRKTHLVVISIQIVLR